MAAADQVKVLSVWRSMFGLRVLMALKEKGVEYDYVEEDLANKSQLLLQSNPVHKKVPVLIHKGKPICESLVIVQYIDETWPSHDNQGFLSQDPYKRALARFWADYVDKKLHEVLVLVVTNVEGEAMEQGRQLLKESMITLDGALQDVFGGGPHFGGDHLNLVDLTLGSYICWFETIEALGNIKVLDSSMCPHLCAWAKVVVEHPCVKESLAITPSAKVLELMQELRKTHFGIDK